MAKFQLTNDTNEFTTLVEWSGLLTKQQLAELAAAQFD
jgi:hypothetical protein